nr:S8 family serine peptidase [Pyrinomonadaceae bacterium]
GSESGSGSTSNIIRAYRYAKMMRERGVNLRVLNNSYGGSGKSQAALDAILELNGAGILFVAAAGNDGTDNFSFPHFPSSYDVPNIIAVASTNSSDNLSGFSNFGARVVSLGAPGSGILSTVPNGGYATFSGTSMATPHVTGAAALVLAANPNLSVQQLRGVLAFSGDVLPPLQSRTTTGRRLNVYRSILSAQESDATAPAPAGNFQVASQDGRNLTLAWTAPGDDGNAGTASDYDFFFVNSATGLRTHLPTTMFVLPAAAGTQQTATVSVPYRNFSGTIELRAYDNAGNFSSTTASVSISQNAGSDPYTINLEAAGALSSGGTPLNLIGDDVFRESYPLPFAFSSFGQSHNSLTVSSNGTLYFSRIPRDADDQTIGLDANSSVEGLTGQTMIAGLWDDIRTDRGGDVYVVQPDADRVIFRWQAVTYDTPLSGGTTRGENPVNFEIELRRDGAIIIRYGGGNTRLFPVVGISGGEPDAYVVDSHTSENSTRNLTNAQTVIFAPRSAVARYAITGRVTDASGNAIRGAQVVLSGSASATTFTDANGNYSFTNLAAGGNYTVTVSGAFYVFNVPTSTANNLSANQTFSFTAEYPQASNPIDTIDGFVRQQYLDFLSREPDAAGFEFWKNIMRQRYAECGAGGAAEQCRARGKASVSEAFFVSVEFQQTGYLVYRFYLAGFDPSARPRGLPRFNEFIADARVIGAGVVVNQAGWEQKLEENKQQFARDFVQRAEFVARHPAGMSAQAFVDTLYQTAGLGTTRTESERQAAITAYGAGDVEGRARALRAVAESNLFFRKEFNKAFVLMQYFGYLRRSPDEGQDAGSFAGYDFWLTKLNTESGDTTRFNTIDELLQPTKRAGMVEAFVITGEYRRRFGPE